MAAAGAGALAEDVNSLTENAYIVMGHGRETAINMEHRWTVPKGVMIIYEKQCGEPLLATTGYKKLHEFIKGNRKLLNPAHYRKELAALFGLDDIKIYGPGMRAPAIEIEFLDSHNLYHSNEGAIKNRLEEYYKNRYYLLKSGVYKFPIDIASITTGRRCKKGGVITECKWDTNALDAAIDEPWRSTYGDLYVRAKTTDDVDTLKKKISAAFRGSIYPRPRDIKRELEGATQEYLVDALNLGMTFFSMKYDLEDIVGDLGSGIYYLTSCRNLKCDVGKEKVAEIVNKSEEAQKLAASMLEAMTKLSPKTPNSVKVSMKMSGKKRRHNAVSSVKNAASAAASAAATSAAVANTNAASASARTPNNQTHKKPRPNTFSTMISARKQQHTISKSARRSGLTGMPLKRLMNRLKLKWGTPGRK